MISKEEIDLCKKIAEKHRKEIVKGDWIIIKFPNIGEIVTLFETYHIECPNRFPEGPVIYDLSTDEYYKEYFPLWQISDCRKFIKSKGYRVKTDENEGGVHSVGCYGHKARIAFNCYNPTLLESYLEAVLAIVEESKKEVK